MRLPFEASIALRYIRARRRAGVSMNTLLTILGVVLGVSALTVVTSVWNGFEAEFLEKLLGINAHTVVLKRLDVFRDHTSVAEKLRSRPEITEVAPFVYSEVIVQTDRGNRGVAVKGIDPKSAVRTPLAKYIDNTAILALADNCSDPQSPKGAQRGEAERRSGRRTCSADNRADLQGVLIGHDLQAGLHAKVGDPLNIISPYGGRGGEARSKAFRIVGVFHSGVHEFDARMIFIDLQAAQNFFRLYDNVTGLELWTKDPMSSRQVANEATRALTPLDPMAYDVRDWSETNRALFGAVRDQKKWISIMLFIIVVVAAFNIMATLILLVIEKTREIAILKSIGATNRSIWAVFMIDGQIVALSGCALGLLLGLTLCGILEQYGLKLDPRVYYLEHLPIVIRPSELALIVFGALSAATLATLFPAISAARRTPVDGLTARAEVRAPARHQASLKTSALNR